MSAPGRSPDGALDELNGAIVTCRTCPRLVEWREKVAREKRSAFMHWDYWGRPVPGFGDPRARLLIVGLAPAAHGGNRTGRIFTGDRSGDWLFASLHRCGFANQAGSVHRDDGLVLIDAYVAAAVRCAPPGNKPTPAERDACRPYLVHEFDILAPRVVVALGSVAWDAVLRVHVERGLDRVRPKPKFGHAAEAELGPYTLIGSFHPSQQNTFTGKLTPAMTDAVFRRARAILEGAP